MSHGSPDVAVVGAGIVGLSTAFALKQRGAQVTLFDPAPPGSGQSAGQSRLFRHAHNDPRLVDFVRHSRALWRQWESDWGVELISDGGSVAIGPAIDRKRKTLDPFNDIPVRTLDPPELRQRLPILAPCEQPAMLDVDGGAIRALSAIGALADRLQDELVADHVLSVRPVSDGQAEVRTGTRCDDFEHVVVCAGRGTATLARGAGMAIPVEVAAHVRLTFPVRGDAPERLPTFQDGSGAFGETGVYASPYPGNRFYSVGLSGTAQVSDDGSLADPAELAAVADRTTEYVERALPGLEPRPVDYVHCWATTLPWGEDGVGVWSANGVSAVVGHNLFKQAPALGEALAQAAAGDGLPEQLRPEARLGHD
ncbi:NAD(P)/FAD-dependent oxidoreductase [Arthrobacter castelli]|uniref:NAD(P)/FAD-dependent oxidoreductase n=1 Tax=Arthrobacter castelli TaxID=271431 RepID=UPI0003FECEFE|nr:FAD-dependent oxidoreductase [Arthrobacter castelli]